MSVEFIPGAAPYTAVYSVPLPDSAKHRVTGPPAACTETPEETGALTTHALHFTAGKSTDLQCVKSLGTRKYRAAFQNPNNDIRNTAKHDHHSMRIHIMFRKPHVAISKK